MATFHAEFLKFALVSHALPPSSSGQAIVLSRLLRDSDPARYCLISEHNYKSNNEIATPRLPGAYFSLGPDPNCRLTNFARTLRPRILPLQKRLRAAFQCFFDSRSNATTPVEFQSADEPCLLRWLTLIKSAILSIEDRIYLRRHVYQRAARIARIAVKERCNAIIACSGNLIDLPASCVAARWVKIPFYGYMFDDYATNSTSQYQRQFSQDMMTRLMREAAGVIVPNDFLAATYQTRYKVYPCIVPNPVDMSAAPAQKGRPLHNTPRLLYTGTLYEAHFDAMHRLLHALTSMGSTAPELHIYTSSTKQYLAKHQIGEPAIIHGAVSADVSIRLQQDADILFLPLAFDSPIPETINTSAPGKMGELLASGRPVLVHAPKNSFVSWYFSKHDCGEVVDEKDPARLRQAIDRLLHDDDHRRRLVSRAGERARCDFALSIARNRFFELLNEPTQRLVS